MILHEEFSEINGQYLNDIAIIKVKSDGNRGINFNSNVRPVCLPSQLSAYKSGMNCKIAGWGSSNNQHTSGIFIQ